MRIERRLLAFKLAACAAVGAVVTLLLCASANTVPEAWRWSAGEQSGMFAWPRTVDAGWPPHATRMDYDRGLVSEVTLFRRDDAYMARFRVGWPLLAMRYHVWRRTMSPGYESDAIRIRGHLLMLPTLIEWPGLVLDTAFHGTLAFLLWSAPGFVRRKRRRRRGLCAHCGYELKGMQKCPECGL